MIATGFFFSMCVLAMVGAWVRRRDAGVRLLVLAAGYFVALHTLLFVGNPRYHAPLYPILAILAAIGGSALWRCYASKSTEGRGEAAAGR
jgi:hypothetical protein